MSGLLTWSLACWVTHIQPRTYPSKWQGQACWHSQPLWGWCRKDLAWCVWCSGFDPQHHRFKVGEGGVQGQRGLYFQLTHEHHTPALQPVSCLFLWTLALSDHIVYFMAKRYCFHLGFYSFLCLFVLRQSLTILLSWVSDFWPSSSFSTFPSLLKLELWANTVF